MQKVEIPRENANDDEVLITDVFVTNHEVVQSGQRILEFETSKASVELEANLDGIISLNVVNGERVAVGKIVAVISEAPITSEEIIKLTNVQSPK